MKIYVLYITTGATPGSGTDADVHVMLQGSSGDTGRRKLIRNGDENFTNGKVYFYVLQDIFSFLEPGPINEDLMGIGKSAKYSLQHSVMKCAYQYLYLLWEVPILMQLMLAILTANKVTISSAFIFNFIFKF